MALAARCHNNAEWRKDPSRGIEDFGGIVSPARSRIGLAAGNQNLAVLQQGCCMPETRTGGVAQVNKNLCARIIKFSVGDDARRRIVASNN